MGTKHPLIVQLDWTLRNGGRTRIRQARSRTRTRTVPASTYVQASSVRTGQRTCWWPSRPAHTSCLVCLLRPIRLRRRGPPLGSRPVVADRVGHGHGSLLGHRPDRPCEWRRRRARAPPAGDGDQSDDTCKHANRMNAAKKRSIVVHLSSGASES